MTNFEIEKDKYILTPEEEFTALANAINAKKEFLRYKHSNDKLKNDIEKRIAAIDWDKEIDRDQILATANANKVQNLWHQERRLQEKQMEEKAKNDLRKFWSAEEMFKHMKFTSRDSHGKSLVVNNDNKSLITALCFFVSEDQRFETLLGHSFKKGLLIRGPVGTGKTHLVSCLQENNLNPILVLSMIEITDELKSSGEYNINMAGKKMIYLDDVGTEEPTINHYGTKISFFKNFIETVYLKNQHKTFNKLIVSTNLNFDQIEERYGFRVRSRFKDMFNVIDVTGKDMRG